MYGKTSLSDRKGFQEAFRITAVLNIPENYQKNGHWKISFH